MSGWCRGGFVARRVARYAGSREGEVSPRDHSRGGVFWLGVGIGGVMGNRGFLSAHRSYSPLRVASLVVNKNTPVPLA